MKSAMVLRTVFGTPDQSMILNALIAGIALCWLPGCGEPASEAPAPPVRKAVEASAPNASATQTSETPPAAAATETSTDTVGAGEMQTFDGMKFLVPAAWKSLPLSSMQVGIIAAKFGIPKISDQISLTLSTSGGSVEDNISRWQGQFQGGDPLQQETLSISGEQCTVVRLQGRFSPGFGRPSEDDWCMTGVIIPMSGQNYYIKLTGPRADVTAAEPEFLAFCRSARPD
jgi:hypothetical protein